MASKKIFSALLLPSLFLFAVTKNFDSKEKEAAPDKNAKGTLLVYTGSIKIASMNIDVGIHIEIAPDVGVRYEMVMEKGSRVMSHSAIFYKFSDPGQSIQYDYLTHSSSVIPYSGKSSQKKDLVLVGNEMVDNYKCTHLRHVNGDEDQTATADYWMSTELPGYSVLMKALSGSGKGNALQKFMPVTGSVFEYGALVKFTAKSSGVMNGSSTVELKEVNSNMSFPESDFEVPKK